MMFFCFYTIDLHLDDRADWQKIVTVVCGIECRCFRLHYIVEFC